MTSEVTFYLRKKIRHDNVNMHQKFQRNWYINEGAIQILAKI